MPPRAFMTVAKAWSRSSVWLLRVICNIRLEVRGLEKIPDGPLIVASKHSRSGRRSRCCSSRFAAVHLQARARLDSVFRLVSDEIEDDRIDRDAGGRALLNMTRRAGAEVGRAGS